MTERDLTPEDAIAAHPYIRLRRDPEAILFARGALTQLGVAGVDSMSDEVVVEEAERKINAFVTAWRKVNQRLMRAASAAAASFAELAPHLHKLADEQARRAEHELIPPEPNSKSTPSDSKSLDSPPEQTGDA